MRYINGRTGKYLEPSVGKANMNIFAMLRPGFQNDFAIAFRKVITTKELVVLHNMKIGANGSTTFVNVNIHWINKPEALFGKILIVFTDVAKVEGAKVISNKGKQVTASYKEKELKNAREEVQNVLE